MSKKSTKKALILSVISLLACVSMLVGSTFAWFTDSVTSAGNKIQAGTLKIDLELLKDGNWVSIKENPQPLFNYDLWEPGYTEVKVLKIENEGTLALKWVAKFQSEVELSKLADVIDVYVLTSETEIGYPTDRADLTGYNKVGTVADFVNTIEETTNGDMLAGEKAYLGIALKMQESAGNEYQGLSLGGAFDIQIFATQYTYEKDSFDEKYDEMAIVSNAADLKAAIAAGQNVILNGDIVADAPIAVAKGAEAIIDLNGHTISRVDADADKNDDGRFTSADNSYIFQVKGNLTVQGEGSIVMEHTGDNMEWNALSACFSVEGGELTLGEGVVAAHKGGTAMAYAVDVNSTLGETVLNVEGATLYSTYTGVRLFNNSASKAIVNYNSGVISGVKRDIWVQYTRPYEVNIADGILYSEANGIYTFDDAVAYVANADGLKAALAGDKDIVLLSDIALDVADTGFTVGNGVSAKIDLNGHDIIATSDSNESVALFYVEGALEIVGEGTISLNNDNYAWNSSYRYTAINIREHGEVTLGEGVNVICETGTDSYGMCYAVDIYQSGILNVNGASLHSNYIAVRCFYGDSVVNVNSGSITSSKNNWGIWPQSAPGAHINIAAGIAWTTDSYGIYIFG